MRDVMRHVLSRYHATDNTRRHILLPFRSQPRLIHLNCSTATAATSSRSNYGTFAVRRKGLLSSTAATASPRNTWCVQRWFHLSTSPPARCHYEILGVATTASQKDIKDAFYHLSKEFHPDRNPDAPEAIERFQQVSAAYEVVGNSINRKQYDATLRPGEGGSRSDGDSFADSGPGFSSMSGKQWRQRRTSFHGYRKTVQDEMFDRWMSDHDEFNRRFQKGFRRQTSNAQHSQNVDSAEWYEQHYKKYDKREHPFEEQEQQQQQQHRDHQQRREEQQEQHRRREFWEAEQRRPSKQPWEEQLRRHNQQQQQEADDRQPGDWHSKERYGGEFRANPKVARIQARVIGFILGWSVIAMVVAMVVAFLQEQGAKGMLGPMFLVDEPEKVQRTISRDEYIRRYYEKLAADQAEGDQAEGEGDQAEGDQAAGNQAVANQHSG